MGPTRSEGTVSKESLDPEDPRPFSWEQLLFTFPDEGMDDVLS